MFSDVEKNTDVVVTPARPSIAASHTELVMGSSLGGLWEGPLFRPYQFHQLHMEYYAQTPCFARTATLRMPCC